MSNPRAIEMVTALLFLTLSTTTRTTAFHPPTPFITSRQVRQTCHSLPPLAAKKNKGFNKTPKKPKKVEEKEASSPEPTTETSSAQSSSKFDDADPELNAGKRALDKLRAKEVTKKEDEIRAMKEIRSVDEFIRDDPNAAAIPEKVAMRMGKRMLPFVGIPLFGGMGAFIAFWYFATYKNMEFQPVLVAGTTIGLLVVGLLGITYSIVSASWDPDDEGSVIGIGEVQNNLDSLKDGLRRTRENAILREKMAGLPEDQIERAIRELDKRDERNKMKTMSLKEKADVWNE